MYETREKDMSKCIDMKRSKTPLPLFYPSSSHPRTRPQQPPPKTHKLTLHVQGHMDLYQGRPKDMEKYKMSLNKIGMNRDKMDLPMDKNYLNYKRNSEPSPRFPHFGTVTNPSGSCPFSFEPLQQPQLKPPSRPYNHLPTHEPLPPR
jgi:hypothetical protein